MALIHSATEIYNALLEKISNEVREASGDDEALLKIIEKFANIWLHCILLLFLMKLNGILKMLKKKE